MKLFLISFKDYQPMKVVAATVNDALIEARGIWLNEWEPDVDFDAQVEGVELRDEVDGVATS